MFQKAARRQAKGRIGLCGVSGSGKTMTALRIAHGLVEESGGTIAVIDTEHGSASLYAGLGIDFDVVNLSSFAPERYIEALQAAADGGYAVVIIDSLSHAWAGKDGILDSVDKAGKRSAGGNFTAWRDATPRHNALVEAMLASPCHVLATLRTKVEHAIETVNGKTVVRKIGLAPVMRDGIEYEFTLCGDVNAEHEFIITKTRAPWAKDLIIREAGEDFGRQFARWLNEGEAPAVEATRFASVSEALARTLAAIENASGTALDNLVQRVEQRAQAGEVTADDRAAILARVELRREALAGSAVEA
jgi:KaiC/GvpD/RAD55 family RecA-like ATPase